MLPEDFPKKQQSLNISASNSDPANTGTAQPYYSIDQRNFVSVEKLVKFYCQNTLKENFPQLNLARLSKRVLSYQRISIVCLPISTLFKKNLALALLLLLIWNQFGLWSFQKLKKSKPLTLHTIKRQSR
jgi:hypothetical protein